MLYERYLSFLGCLTLLGALTACGGQPYVHAPGEFNRESEAFLQGVTARADVTICYSKRSSTTQAVAQAAAEECQRFGKRAEFMKQSLELCPLTAPAAAIYYCLAPGERISDLKR